MPKQEFKWFIPYARIINQCSLIVVDVSSEVKKSFCVFLVLGKGAFSRILYVLVNTFTNVVHTWINHQLPKTVSILVGIRKNVLAIFSRNSDRNKQKFIGEPASNKCNIVLVKI